MSCYLPRSLSAISCALPKVELINFVVTFVIMFAVSSLTSSAEAGPRDQAYQLFNRLTGVPPSPEVLDALAAKIAAGDPKAAALAAIDDQSGVFYSLMLKDLISRWSNVDRTPRVELNDFTATIIGMVRDGLPFDQILSADLVYVADTAKIANVPAYSLDNNNHYKFLETQNANLKEVLVAQKQSSLTTVLPAEATAGVMTTRGFATSFFKAGTNRRAAALSFDTFLCRTMEQLADTTRSDFHVRRDVTRAPGGDSSLFRNRCAGCHAGMDAMAGAFAFYDVIDGATADTDRFVYTPGQVAIKMNRNASEFPDGYVTVDDSWMNNWLEGQNASLGWNGAPSGNGAKELGEMLTATDAFGTCMAQRAMTAICLHAPTTAEELAAVKRIAEDFRKDFNMKNVFAEAAVVCTRE